MGHTSYTRLVALRKRQAEKRRDREAARFLIQEFVNHADAIERRISSSDGLVVRFIAKAMRKILAGKAPSAALSLGTVGRAPVPGLRDSLLALQVFAAYQRLKKRAKESDGGAVKWAFSEVAKRTGTGRPTVRAAWQANGGLKGVTKLAEEMEYGHLLDSFRKLDEMARMENARPLTALRKEMRAKKG